MDRRARLHTPQALVRGIATAVAALAVPAAWRAPALAAATTIAPTPDTATQWVTAGLLLSAPVAAMLLAGYSGYFLRVRPQKRLRGHLDIRGPDGEPLGRLRIPLRQEVAVGAAMAKAHLRLPWLSGSDGLFRLRVDVETAGGTWRAGIAAWVRRPAVSAWAEAEWPYHLYSPHSGPLPRRRVDLDVSTPFSASGLSFTYLAAAGTSTAAPPVADLLSALSQAGDGGATSAAEAGGVPDASSPPLPGNLDAVLRPASRALGSAAPHLWSAWHAAACRMGRARPCTLLDAFRWCATAVWTMSRAAVLSTGLAGARWMIRGSAALTAVSVRRLRCTRASPHGERGAARRTGQWMARRHPAWPDAPARPATPVPPSPPTRRISGHAHAAPGLVDTIRAATRWVAADLVRGLRFDEGYVHRGAHRRNRARHKPAPTQVPWSPSASPEARASGSDLLRFLHPPERR